MGQTAGGAPEPAKLPKPTPAAPRVVAPSTVEQLDQQIAFDAALPATAYVGRTLTVTASATSGLPVTLSVGGNSNVCKLTGSALMLRSAGVCTIEARQPGNARYKGRRVEGSFVVVRAAQTISFLDAAPAGAVVGGRYRLDARATSGLAVAVSSLTPDVCTLAGPNVRTIGVGSCTIGADQTGNDAFEPAAHVQVVFDVLEPDPGPRSQTVAFSSTAPSGALVGGAAYLVSATASSGLTVDLSVDAASAGVCAITGNRITFIGEVTCTVGAGQSGGHGFPAAPPVSQSILVARTPQAVSFLSTPPASAVAGVTTYLVVAAASASLPVTLSVAQSSAAVCAISGAIVTAIAAGTCEVDADQPGDITYQPAAQAVQTFSVGSATPSLSVQTINFTSTPPASSIVGGPGYALAATATSGLPVVFSAAASSVGICTVTGSTVALLGAGTCTIVADQSGSTAYAPAAQVQQSFSIALAAQAITFTSVPPVPAAAGGTAYTIAAVASSGLTVTFSLAPASSGICSVTGAAVSLLADGTCTIFGRPVWRCGARGRRPGHPELHDRCRSGEHEPADDQLHHCGAGRRGDRRELHARCVRQLRAADHLRRRSDECGRLRPLRGSRVLRRDRHLQGASRPGGQRELRPSASGVPVLRRLTATARPPDDCLHVARPGCGGLWRRAVRRRRNRELRPARRLLDSGIEQRHLHGLRIHGLARRRRYLHDLRESDG